MYSKKKMLYGSNSKNIDKRNHVKIDLIPSVRNAGEAIEFQQEKSFPFAELENIEPIEKVKEGFTDDEDAQVIAEERIDSDNYQGNSHTKTVVKSG